MYILKNKYLIKKVFIQIEMIVKIKKNALFSNHKISQSLYLFVDFGLRL